MSVGRYCLDFASGVRQNSFQVRRSRSKERLSEPRMRVSEKLAYVGQMSKTPPTYFWTSDANLDKRGNCARVVLAAASATPNIRKFEAIVSNKHQLVLKHRMLERRTEATIRKAMASKSTRRGEWHPADCGLGIADCARAGLSKLSGSSAVRGAQNSLVWVLRICRVLDTSCHCARRRAAVAQ